MTRPHSQIYNDMALPLHSKYDTKSYDTNNVVPPPELPMSIIPHTTGIPSMIVPDDPDETHSDEDDLTNRVKRSQSDLERFSHLPEALQPIILFRNLFHTATLTLSGYSQGSTDGYRVYIEESVGYSGNATRFKRNPDMNEKAFVLHLDLTDPKGEKVEQCKTCKEYYQHQNYFKASPDALGRLILVKNNAPIRIEKDNFKVHFKIMCACSHHGVDYFNCHLSLKKAGNESPLFTASTIVYAKQWRKSKQAKEEVNLTMFPPTPTASVYNEASTRSVYNANLPTVENSG